MTRMIQDSDLLVWEAYAAPGAFGFPDGSKMVFHCLTQPERRARVLERDKDISEVAGEISHLSDAELLRFLESGEDVS